MNLSKTKLKWHNIIPVFLLLEELKGIHRIAFTKKLLQKPYLIKDVPANFQEIAKCHLPLSAALKLLRYNKLPSEIIIIFIITFISQQNEIGFSQVIINYIDQLHSKVYQIIFAKIQQNLKQVGKLTLNFNIYSIFLLKILTFFLAFMNTCRTSVIYVIFTDSIKTMSRNP